MSDHLDDRAACRDLPAGVFFLEKGDDAGPAKAICATCPVARACLESALERDEEFGIWGGAGESERRFLARAWRDRVRDPRRWQREVGRWLHRLAADVAGTEREVVNRNTEAATCGLRSTYARGCRCPACTFAAALNTREENPRRRRATG